MDLGKAAKKGVERERLAAAVSAPSAYRTASPWVLKVGYCTTYSSRTSPKPTPPKPADDDNANRPYPKGMRYSLQSREIIADSIETITCAQHHDANISIPGCDKNMPGVIMAAARHNRPFIMIYGGTILKGNSDLYGGDINIATCYEASGAYGYGKLKPKCEGSTASASEVLEDIERHACPGAPAPAEACIRPTRWRRRSRPWA